MPRRPLHLLALLAACLGLAFGLAACGGDSSDDDADSIALTELPRDPQNGSTPGRPSDGRLVTGDDGVAATPAEPDVAGGGAAGDGGDDDAATEPAEPDDTDAAEPDAPEADAGGGSAANAEGEAIFTQSCAGCHTLAAAGASGSVGPNLDESGMDAAAIAEKVRTGGGGMPSFGGQLEPAQIDAVAAYVADAAGS